MRLSNKGNMVNHTFNQITGVDFRDSIQTQEKTFGVEAAQEFSITSQQLRAIRAKMNQK